MLKKRSCLLVYKPLQNVKSNTVKHDLLDGLLCIYCNNQIYKT